MTGPGRTPSMLVFDVNETLIDIDSIAPVFADVFGDPAVLREWFAQLVTYSMSITLSARYVDFFTLGQAVLRMVAATHQVTVTDADADALRQAMRTMPAHDDVEPGLAALRDNGFRMATLTNSPPVPGGSSPLEHAGLSHFFERQLSVDACRAYKPAPAVYRYACAELEVAPQDCMMVAAHAWDVLGAQSCGFTGAMITRPGNAALLTDCLPPPTVVVGDIRDLAGILTAPPA